MRTVLAIGVIFGIQILFFLINRRELARSEFYIYILFASLALTGGWAHVVGVSIFKKQSLHLTIISRPCKIHVKLLPIVDLTVWEA